MAASAVSLRVLRLIGVLTALAACSSGMTPAPFATPEGSEAALPPRDAPSSSAASSALPAPGEGALVLRGTPDIPAALRDRLARYLDTRSAVVQGIRDDGSALLVTTRFSQTDQLHWVGQPLGARTQLTFSDEPIRSAALVPGAPHRIVYLSDAGGNELYQLFLLDRDRDRPQLLTDGRSRHDSYRLSWDGKRIAYTGNARNGKDMDIYVADALAPGAGKLWLERRGSWWLADWSRDGRYLLLGEFLSINDARLHIAELDSKKVTRITPEGEKASYRSAVFSAKADRVYAASDRESDLVELYEIEPSTGKHTPLSRHIRWNVTELALSGDGRTLAFVTNEDGYGVLHLLDTASRREKELPKLPGEKGIVGNLRFAKGANRLGFTLQGPTRNGDAYTLDLDSGEVRAWTASELGGLDAKRFVSPELIRYPTFDKREIPAFYYRPAGNGPHPVVVLIHGGPESQARPYFSPLVQYLVAESKAAVLVPNVRGSDGYGKAYLLLDNGKQREDSVKDIGALLDWIGRRPELDAKRVAVFGGSYGGYMVLASLVHFPERLVAGVDYVGISSFVTFLENTKPYRRDLRRAEYGDERDPAMRAFLQSISPTTNAARIRSALFVAHGANDPRVPLSETDQIVAAVQREGREVWYMVANNEGHGFRKKDNRDRFYELSILFLEKHLRIQRP